MPAARWRDKYQTWFATITPFLEASNEFRLWDFTKFYDAPENRAARTVYISNYFCPSRRGSSGEGRLSPASIASVYEFQGSTGDYGGNYGRNIRGVPVSPRVVYDELGVLITPECLITAVKCKSYKSPIAFKHISDGLSKTFLVGERHVPASQFSISPPDDSIFQGDHLINHCRAAAVLFPPAPSIDYFGTNPDWRALFGSNHPGVTQFVRCNGSVKTVPISVDLTVYEAHAARNQAEVASTSEV